MARRKTSRKKAKKTAKARKPSAAVALKAIKSIQTITNRFTAPKTKKVASSAVRSKSKRKTKAPAYSPEPYAWPS